MLIFHSFADVYYISFTIAILSKTGVSDLSSVTYRIHNGIWTCNRMGAREIWGCPNRADRRIQLPEVGHQWQPREHPPRMGFRQWNRMWNLPAQTFPPNPNLDGVCGYDAQASLQLVLWAAQFGGARRALRVNQSTTGSRPIRVTATLRPIFRLQLPAPNIRMEMLAVAIRLIPT